MRFAQAHKNTTYAMATSAFLSVAFSGMLNPILMLLCAGGIVGSWYWEAPRVRVERYGTAWTVFALLAFCYQVISWLATGQILLAGSSFLVILMLVKLYNRNESKDYLHIYVLSFLMLTAGTVLNAEITYGLFFLAYVICATWALIIFQLRRELEDNFLLRHEGQSADQRVRIDRVMNSKRIVGRKFFVGTALVSLAIFASALALFLLFPRIGFGFFFDKSRGGITMTGFSDGVTLGDHGLIKKDTRVVMRVSVDKGFRGRQAPYLHWRGVAFDNYSKGEWKRSTKTAPETQRVVEYEGRKTIHHLYYAFQRPKPQIMALQRKAAMKQDVYLEPLGSDVLFGASMPIAFEFGTTVKNRTHLGQNDELRHVHQAGLKYTVYSNPSDPPTELLRAAPKIVPQGYSVYLQLPPEIPECDEYKALASEADIRDACRIRDLARWITRDAKTDYDKARALETWLRTELGYTLEMKSPGGMEPVEYFLFERRLGHCEYFSSAMSVMARALGIPVRNVNGFSGGEWNEIGEFIAVRAGDAHSWVEVYFHGQGWVTFDPTPAGESDLLGRGSSSVWDKLRRIGDTLRFKWFKWVIEYDLYAQLKLFKSIGNALRGGAKKAFSAPMKELKAWAKRHKRSFAFALMAFVAIVAAFSIRRQRRREEDELLPRKRIRKAHPIRADYLFVLRALARRGFKRDDATTPREFGTRLGQEGLSATEEFRELTELYYRAQYEPDTEASVKRSSELRGAIVRRLKEKKDRRRAAAPL